MYNLIKYSDNYSDSTASLYQFERQEQNYNDDGNIDNITADDSSSFTCKSGLLKSLTADDIVDGNAVWKKIQIIVPIII